MAKLTSRARKRLPKSKFALPSKKAYPINDRRHAANAKARASQELDAGKLSEAEFNKINAAANRVLKRGK